MANELTHREKKYDRQLRLWGLEGQMLLEGTHFCVLGSGPAATETIKNLVLPGCGRFTIIDDKHVTERDLTNNFFLTAGHVNEPRAKVAAALLKELNDDIQAVEAIVESPVKLIENDPSFVTKYSMIMATDLPESAMLKLAASCEEHKVPLFLIRIYGWMAYLRIQVPGYPVIESKPPNIIPDLRLSSPWPELAAFAETFDFDSMTESDYAHVPFPVILIKAVQLWRKAEGVPAEKTPSFANKKSILDILSTLRKKGAGANFEEANKFAMRTYVPYRIPDEVQTVLNDPRASASEFHEPFWLVVAALKAFLAKEGQGTYLPLLGEIPDMETESAIFVKIKAIYNAKFDLDVAAVKAHIADISKRITDSGKFAVQVPDEYAVRMCKNVAAIRAYHFRSIADEYNPANANRETLEFSFEQPETNLIWYFLMRAADRFYAQHGHFPCSNLQTPFETELQLFTDIVHSVLADYSISEELIPANHIHEFARWGGGTLHAMGALLGGVAAQEAIKVITKQWEPLNNTWIFNGLQANSSQFVL